jgi:predicted short-subunit dehydrogenase-like oxidoreductase (DUF2520 family)
VGPAAGAILGRATGSPERGTGTIEERPSSDARSTTVVLIGAGRAATAFGVLLQRAGHRVSAGVGRSGTRDRLRRHLPTAQFLPLDQAGPAAAAAGVVVIGVPDDVVDRACRDLATAGGFRPGQWAVHLSGSLGLDALAGATALGAEPLSLHPLQTFPTVEGGVERLPGSAVAVTAASEHGYATGEALAREVGGRPFRLADAVKPLYHAAAVFCSNYLVAVEGLAESLFRLAGLDDPLPLFAPLARAALDSALEVGPAAALTGPAARGDAGTVARNLRALAEHAPEAIPPYVALARAAADLAGQAGALDAERRAALERELARWR